MPEMVYSLRERSSLNCVAGLPQVAHVSLLIAVVRPIVCSRKSVSCGDLFDGVAIRLEARKG